MHIDLDDQAYALAILSGPPVYDVSEWTKQIAGLAQEAEVGDLLEAGGTAKVAEYAHDRSKTLTDPRETSRLKLLSEWLDAASGAVTDWHARSQALLCHEEELFQFFERSRAALADYGIEIPDETHFEVTDRFPKPFDRENWSAFCPDPEDEKRFGIRAGIYLRRDRIRPLQTACLVAHELIHVVPGLKDGDMLAMGLEEGLADMLGSLLVSRRLLLPNVVDNVFTYSRLGPPRALPAAYLQHARQAFVIYSQYATPGLVALVNGGRRAIHAAERSLVQGELPVLDVPLASPERGELGWIARLLQSGLNHLVVSPLEYRVAREARSGLSVQDVSRKVDVKEEDVSTALSALSDRTMMIVLNDETIEFSNFDVYGESYPRAASTTLRVSLGDG
jgi:hypothetical protein